MVNVSFYAFSKRRNSTAVPSGAPLTFSCTLKDACSVISPIVGIQNGAAWNPAGYNYAAIGDFSRFYYVTDWTYSGGIWWASLNVDTLATYKTAILNNTAYIARASKQYDGQIADAMFPAKFDLEGWTDEWPSTPHTPWARAFSSGFYVAGIINNDGGSIGAVSYYAFTPAQFADFKAYLLGDYTWTDITTSNPDLGENLYKSLFNPFQYIVSVIWLPLTFSTSWGTLLSSLKFGWWTLSNVACYRLTTFETYIDNHLDIGEHPQVAARGTFLNGPPFSAYRLYAPPFGEFTLDGTLLSNSPYTQHDTTKTTPLYINIHVDFVTGAGVLNAYVAIGGGESATMVLAQANVGVPIQIAQINNDSWGGIRNAVETVAHVAGSASSMDIGGAVSSAATGVLNAIELQIPHVQQQGNNGSIAIYAEDFRLENIFTIVADDANADKGRPLCKELQIGDLAPGFVQVVGSHVAVAGTEAEIEAINEFLETGVYLE